MDPVVAALSWLKKVVEPTPRLAWGTVGMMSAAAVCWATLQDPRPRPLEGLRAVAAIAGIDASSALERVNAYLVGEDRVVLVAWAAFALLLFATLRTAVLGFDTPPYASEILGSTMWVSLAVLWQTGQFPTPTMWFLLVLSAAWLVWRAWSHRSADELRTLQGPGEPSRGYDMLRSLVYGCTFVLVTLLGSAVFPVALVVSWLLDRSPQTKARRETLDG